MSKILTNPSGSGVDTPAVSAADAATAMTHGPTRIKPVSRKDAVRIEIRRAIITGRLHPGDKITETQLASDLGVSRPTIREALNALVEEGFVTKEPYRGLRIAFHSSTEVHDMAVTRNALDMVAIDAILADETGDKLELVEAEWERYAKDAFNPDPVVQHDSHLRFHESIWAASGNEFIMKLWPVTAAQLTLAFAEEHLRVPDPNHEYASHKKIMMALRSRDRETILTAVSEHTLTTAATLHDLLKAEGR